MSAMDDWDEAFLNEALQLEFQALSSRTCPSHAPPIPHPPLTCPSRDPLHPVPLRGPVADVAVLNADAAVWAAGSGYSPPRELSQRQGGNVKSNNIGGVSDFDMVETWGAFGKSDGLRRNSGNSNSNSNSNSREFERLKGELTYVRKQLTNLERECTELKRDTTEKETQLRNALGEIEARDTEIVNLKRANTEAQSHISGNERMHKRVPASSFSSNGEIKGGTMNFHFNEKDIKVGPNPVVQELRHRTEHDAGLRASVEGSIKEIISSEKKKKSDLMDSEVQTDFPLESNPSDKNNNSYQNNQSIHAKSLHWKLILNNLRVNWGLVPIGERSQRDIISRIIISCSEEFFLFLGAADVAETGTKDVIFRIHSIIEKSHNETEQLRYIVEELLNICRFQNVSIVAKSLKLLHRILHQLISSQNTSTQRKNILIEQDGERNGLEREISIFNEKTDFEILPLELWSSIYDTMREIAMKNQDFASDALSVMILIVMISNVNTNREKFGLVAVLECLHEIVKRQKDPSVKEKTEVGLSVKKQAVYLLFLILNCPKMLALFCTGGRENSDLILDKSEGLIENVLQQLISSVLEDLGYCLWEEKQEIRDKYKEDQDKFISMLELKLVRQVIILLAYIASYGESGFELLLGPVGRTGLNLLERIVKTISSQMDLEINHVDDKSHALCNKERYMVFREALILLNRLISHTIYSQTTLQVLTSSQSCASLAIEIANRMPCIGQSNNINIEIDIADLALAFRNRVFSFLGEK